MGDPITSDGKTPRKDDKDRSEGQYGGLDKGLGYGGGRDPKDAERPAEDIDLDAEDPSSSER